MNVFIIAANAVLISLTLVVIVFAKQTVTESRKATQAARDTASALENLLAVAQATAASSESAARAARETVDAAREARVAEERDRKVQRLRQIAELVERIFEQAAAADGRTRPAWRCMEQRGLPPLLVSDDPPLPECHTLAGASQAGQVYAAAVDARKEITGQLRKLTTTDAV
jgi:hypothetical protein